VLALHMSPASQAWPQVAQFWSLVATSTHEPEQGVSPPGQVSPHMPAPQTWPASQPWPHAPQSAKLCMVSMQLPEQSVNPN
jgi:hypothetical protein